MRGIIVTLALLCASHGYAQTLDEQERINQLNQVDKLTKDVLAKADGMALEKKSQCLAAIANQAACECFSLQLPVIINFVQYVAIVSKTKEELGYDNLKPNDKLAVDYVRKARDLCVGKKIVPAR